MDEYLKTLLEQIRCKKARPYVKKELQDHIEDQIEANMQAGICLLYTSSPVKSIFYFSCRYSFTDFFC